MKSKLTKCCNMRLVLLDELNLKEMYNTMNTVIWVVMSQCKNTTFFLLESPLKGTRTKSKKKRSFNSHLQNGTLE